MTLWGRLITCGPIANRPFGGLATRPQVGNLPHNSGFTLLEVLVATVILAIAVTGLMASLSGSMRNASRLTDYDRAALFARRKMDEILEDKKLPKFTVLEGQWDPGYTGGKACGWKARIQPWEMLPTPAAGMMALDRVELEIWWMDGETRRSFPLEAFRRATMTESDVRGEAQKPEARQ